MPVFQLTDDVVFPPPNLAEQDGLLAVGGDLSEKRILRAYAEGIFPWYSEDQPILWWSPDPRMVLFPDDLRVSKSLQRELRKGCWDVSIDGAFEEVLAQCAQISRPDQDGTWITSEMREAYVGLHHSGYAHSVECRQEGELVGGLYGVSLGGCFFGESMFSLKPNASKVALASLVGQLRRWNFQLIDCQVRTEHLESLGAVDVPRTEFLEKLDKALVMDSRVGRWRLEEDAT